MSDAHERLSRNAVMNCDRSDSRESNTRESHTSKGIRRPVATRSALRGVRTRLSRGQSKEVTAQAVCGVFGRRGRSRPHTMHDHTDDREHYSGTDTSGCVRGASGVPPTRPAAGEGFSPSISGGQVTASGTSGVYRCYARERTRTPARGHTYARLRKVGIPLTPLTRVRGTRRSYQNAEVSE